MGKREPAGNCFKALTRKVQRLAGVVIALLLAGAFTTRLRPQSPPPGSSSLTNNAVFDRDGNLRLPVGYRNWEHVGTRIKADGLSVLDNSKITVPEMMDAYVEPSAYEAFKKTTRWPDGTQIVKEYSLIKTGPNCSRTNFVCSTIFGRGVFEDHYAGLGMMVKDAKHFPTSAGNWGYFSFLPAGNAYQRSASTRPREQCSVCHEERARETDYVFSKSHIGLLPGDAQ